MAILTNWPHIMPARALWIVRKFPRIRETLMRSKGYRFLLSSQFRPASSSAFDEQPPIYRTVDGQVVFTNE